MIIWYIFPVLICCTNKNLATLVPIALAPHECNFTHVHASLFASSSRPPQPQPRPPQAIRISVSQEDEDDDSSIVRLLHNETDLDDSTIEEILRAASGQPQPARGRNFSPAKRPQSATLESKVCISTPNPTVNDNQGSML
jgi:hypothetical protein